MFVCFFKDRSIEYLVYLSLQYKKKLLNFFFLSKLKLELIVWDNYSKPTWGLARLRFAYLWFKTLHFAHLRLLPLGLCYPPPLKRRLNMYFCTIFMSLSSQNIKHKKFKRKQDQNVLLVKNIMQFLELQLVFELIISTTNKLIIHLKAW